MVYPDKLMVLQDGYKLYVPDEERIKPVYEALLAKDPATPFPFWAKIWPSAIAMTDFLKTEPDLITGKRVLEIGAGIGLPSFVMAAYTGSMVISDHAPEAVALMEKNIRYLGLPLVKAMCLDWNHFPSGCEAETVLLSDINYAPDQFGALLNLIRELIGKGSTLVLSTPHRITVTPFAGALQPYIKRNILKTVEQGKTTIDIRILILSA